MPTSRHRSPDTPNTASRYPVRPWIHGGIDYGPAIVAVHDLVAWAFDVAARGVDGWPDGRRRMLAARRFVLARLRGTRARRVSSEDVVFTAGLLARIFDEDLALGMSEAVTILDAIGLPTDVVPFVPRPPAAGKVRPMPDLPRRPRPPAMPDDGDGDHVPSLAHWRFRDAA